MQLFCKESANLVAKLKQCKTHQQIHQIHTQIITGGLLFFHPSSSYLLTSLLHHFTSLLHPQPPQSHSHSRHSIQYALSIFKLIRKPNTFVYNTIIRTHTLLDKPDDAITFFIRMRSNSVPPDAHTFPFLLTACGKLRSPFVASALHCLCFKFGFGLDVFVCNTLIRVYSVCDCIGYACRVFDESSFRDVVSYNVMIDGFVKVGDVVSARRVFDRMPVRDAVTWGTLLAGYAKMEKCKEAVELFDHMIDIGVRPDNIALVSALSACAQLGKLEEGKSIHDYIERNRIRVDVFLSTALVDLYAKCGCIDIAMEIFQSSIEKNLCLWNAVLVGLAMHGQGKVLLDYFSVMVKSRVQPDGVTFLGVLVGCSHAGLINEARQLFIEMESVYGVERELKHYGCMADSLGRAGMIKEAVEMIEKMPMGGDVFVWGGLLAGCRLHGNVEIAEKAAEHIREISPRDGGVYSTMVNIYANADRWDESTLTRRLRDLKKVKKNAGCSWIQLDGVTHEFVAGDYLHPNTEDIYLVLDGIGHHQLNFID